MPNISEFVYNRVSNAIVGTKLRRAEVKRMYEDFIGAVTIRTAVEVFRANEKGLVQSLSVQIMAANQIPGTNRATLVPLVEWAPTWSEIESLIDDDSVDAKSLLDLTNAVVSKNLLNLVPVRTGKSIRRL
jgi:hypothetical protein